MWISLSQFPFLHGKYLFYKEYTALFGCIFCVMFFLFFVITKSIISFFILPRYAQKKDQTKKNNESNELLPLTIIEDPHAPAPEAKADPDTNPYLKHKHRQWTHVYSVLSYLAWLALGSIFIILSAFSILPLQICYPFSFMLLLIAFVDTRNLEEPTPTVSPRKKKKSSRTRNLFPKSKFLQKLFWVAFGLKTLAYFMTYKSCFIDHVRMGIPIDFFVYTSAFTRFFTLDRACPPGPPCHVYMTLPFETSKSAFVNIHTHSNVDEVFVTYGLKREIDRGDKAAFSAKEKIKLYPSEFDYIGERNVHSVLLENLIADELYEVFIIYSGRVQKQFTYRSLPDETTQRPYNIIYSGDVGYSKESIAMSDVIAKQDPVAIFIGGDIAYDNGDPNCYYAMDLFLSVVEKNIYDAMGRVVPMIMAIGNHDVGLNNLADRRVQIDENFPTILTYFPQDLVKLDNYSEINKFDSLQSRSPFGAHKIGKVVNFVLDSGYMANFEGAQTFWLNKMLDKYANYTKIAVYHDPMYSLFANFTDTGKNDYIGRSIWLPILEKHNFKAGFEHHVHAFKRTHPIRNGKVDPTGVVYFGDGCWGVETTHSDESKISPEWKSLYAKYAKKNNVWVVNFDAKENKITYLAVGLDGKPIDDPYVMEF